jgi:hypothetical protein
MQQLVTLSLVKQHLRLVTYDINNQPIANTAEDETLNAYIDSASAYVQDYIGHTYADDEVVPAPVRHACLLLVGESYARREQAVVGTISDTKAVENLLQAHRKFTVY